MQKQTTRRLLFLSLFAAAMGWLEGVVVVYLRALYYPMGFSFPLAAVPSAIALCELLREICTLIMLGSVALLAERDRVRRAAAFLWTFGVWDIVYYAALKTHLNWPPSLLTWDLLFLIPVAWAGPVLAPVLCSLVMVSLAAGLYRCTERWENFRFGLLNWILCLSGSLMILASFMRDYARLLVRNGFLPKLFTLFRDERFLRISASFTPADFAWPLFSAGLLLIAAVAVRIWLQMSKAKLPRVAG